MLYTGSLMAELDFSGETVLLCLALFLAVVFLGLLVLDRVARRRRRRRHGREPETLGARLRKPFKQIQALRGEMRHMFRERAHRKRGRGRRPPETPW
jgi:hypothetical protein